MESFSNRKRGYGIASVVTAAVQIALVVMMILEMFSAFQNSVNEISDHAGDSADHLNSEEIMAAGIFSEDSALIIPEDIIGKDLSVAVNELENMGITVWTASIDTTQMTQNELDQIRVGTVISSAPVAVTQYLQTDDNCVTLYYY